MFLDNVAVRRPRNVQSKSMVALAPITNETPAWDVLDAFPKLHSRAREAKTTPCTEVLMHKSRSRIEICLTIYETCDRLESFTRDPIGYFDGLSIYMSYFHMDSTDPMGEDRWRPRTVVKRQWSIFSDRSGNCYLSVQEQSDTFAEVELNGPPIRMEGYWIQGHNKFFLYRIDAEYCGSCADEIISSRGYPKEAGKERTEFIGPWIAPPIPPRPVINEA